ncbi:hypothetical protein PR048_012681 [Dryococelus australis]|uniref:Uncharacterized protein n=1 Tax=Dryococelus australis TaxID=614101 RepID=A0ABQ9HQ27_9NEOP|nr:hypothetical protein PR048_012681 [Dryococelus australis]
MQRQIEYRVQVCQECQVSKPRNTQAVWQYSATIATGMCLYWHCGTFAKKSGFEYILVGRDEGFTYFLGCKVDFSTPCHPQANMVVRHNRNLKIALYIFQSGSQRKWDEVLCYLGLCFNNVVSQAIKHAPAELFFGRRLLHSMVNAWLLNGPEWGSVEPNDMERLWNKVGTKIGGPFKNVSFLTPVTLLLENPQNPYKIMKAHISCFKPFVNDL